MTVPFFPAAGRDGREGQPEQLQSGVPDPGEESSRTSRTLPSQAREPGEHQGRHGRSLREKLCHTEAHKAGVQNVLMSGDGTTAEGMFYAQDASCAKCATSESKAAARLGWTV